MALQVSMSVLGKGKCQISAKVNNADFREKFASFADFNIYDMRQYCIITYVRHE
jgi:hypothetical protein